MDPHLARSTLLQNAFPDNKEKVEIKDIVRAVTFNNQHCGIYAGDWSSYKDFPPVFDHLIQEYNAIRADAVHTSDIEFVRCPMGTKNSSVFATMAGQVIDGFGLSFGITKEQRVKVEKLMEKAIQSF